jgi:hypothetical protein
MDRLIRVRFSTGLAFYLTPHVKVFHAEKARGKRLSKFSSGLDAIVEFEFKKKERMRTAIRKNMMDDMNPYKINYFVPDKDGCNVTGAVNSHFLGPTFGLGDLTLFDKKDGWGKSKLGRQYRSENRHEFASRYSLFGMPYFEVSEMEVYSVKLIRK